jgi:hypothetical protein
MQIEFGCFAPSLKEQLAGMGFAKGDLDHWQLIAKSLTVLRACGYISKSVRDKGERKIAKEIEEKYLERIKNEPPEVSQ